MKKTEHNLTAVGNDGLYEFSRDLILRARQGVYQVANFLMVGTYWKIGERIVAEQGKEGYAKYGEELLKSVSARLRAEFGKGFTYDNLTNMRKFYLQFPMFDALRQTLSWTHYRSLIRVEDPKAREVYMNEAADNAWSTRFLDEQVDKHYYERLISTHKEAVNALNDKNAAQLTVKPQDFILKDPLLLDFYELRENASYNESDVEQVIIGNLQKFLLELGKGFSFVARQQRVATELSHYYIRACSHKRLCVCL